jgi:ribosome-binding factor A
MFENYRGTKICLRAQFLITNYLRKKGMLPIEVSITEVKYTKNTMTVFICCPEYFLKEINRERFKIKAYCAQHLGLKYVPDIAFSQSVVSQLSF